MTTYRYANMDHSEFLPEAVRHATGPAAEFARRVAHILGNVGGGLYNCPININRIDWLNGHHIRVIWNHTELATWDLDGLTKLVFFAHHARIRVSIRAAAPRRLELLFHQRQNMTGDEPMARGHPHIDQALAMFASAVGLDHPTTYPGDEVVGRR